MATTLESRPIEVKVKTNCRNCNGRLSKILDLGEQFPIGFEGEPQIVTGANNVGYSQKFPLCLMMCKTCSLVQLRHTVDPELLFRNYHYRSGVNQAMKDELFDIMTSACNMAEIMPGDVVVDIGANDGTLLSMFPPNLRKVGFEPSNAIDDAVKNCDLLTTSLFRNFFKPIEYLVTEKAKVITAIAMFYDLDDPHQFLRDVKKILAPDGIFVVQMNYLGLMVHTHAFDNISHEHLCYYSVKTFAKLLIPHDLEIVKVTFNDINGGSFRCYIKHIPVKNEVITSKKTGGTQPTHEFNQDVLDIIQEEKHLEDPRTYKAFAQDIRLARRETVDFLKDQKKKGKMVIGYGASTRGFVLIQYFKLWRFFDKIADINPDKWGKTLVGTNIKIISEGEMRKLSPAFLFVLPWYYHGFEEREKKFLEGGGQMIFPLPRFRVR